VLRPTERALRLGLLISPTERDGETQAEMRLTGILQAYTQHLEKHIEPTALPDLLKIPLGIQPAIIKPPTKDDWRFLWHGNTPMKAFASEIFMAWQYPHESVCECGRHYYIDSKKMFEFYRNQLNYHKPVRSLSS
jgi:hypothetical protein